MKVQGTVIGFDLGTRHIGVAIRPAGTEIILPRPSLHVQDDASSQQAILQVIQAEEPVAVVVGMPLTMRGEVGPQAASVETFVEKLRPLVACEIHLADERLSSQLPDDESGVDDHGRAAQSILETWLSAQ